MTAPTSDGNGYGPEFFEDLGVGDDPKAERQANRAEDEFDQDQVLAKLCPDGLLPSGFAVPQYPRQYEVDGFGVWRVEYKAAKDKGAPAIKQRGMVAPAPCLVVGRFQDPEGRELSLVAWKRDGGWHKRPVPREVMLSARKLVPELAGHGFPVSDGTGRGVEAWLSACEAHNVEVLEPVRIARHLGWQPGRWADGRVFVTGPDQPLVGGTEDERRPVHPHVSGQEAALAAHRAEGTLAQWQEHVARGLEGRPLAQMGVYASLAAPLLEVLGVESFTADWSGGTTRGKSTTLEAAVSCFAEPGASMKTWGASAPDLYNRLALVRGVPVAIDESMLCKKPEVIEELVYNIPFGRSPGRALQGGGSRPSVTWQTVVLSSGEQSILSFGQKKGGAVARVLELVGSPFDRDGAGADALAADAVKAGAYSYYGTAGPAFVEQLQKDLQGEGLARIRDEHQRAVATFRQDATSLGARRAPAVAALWVAAHLAHRYGVVPFAPPELDVWRELFQAQEAHDDRPGEALRAIRNWVVMHSKRMWTPEGLRRADEAEQGEPFEPVPGWAGRWEGDGGFALEGHVLREVLAERGFELAAVQGAWVERGAMRKEGGKGRNFALKRDMPRGTVRVYVFSPEVEDVEDDGDRGDDTPPTPDPGPADDVGPPPEAAQTTLSPDWVDRLEVVGLCEVCRDNCRFYDPEDASRVIHPQCANPAGGRSWQGTAAWAADGRPGLAGGAGGGAA